MKEATLLFLVRRNQQTGDQEILLAMKKRGFGVGKWNGTGGKFDAEKDKTIEDTAKREAREEIGIDIIKMEKVGVNRFPFDIDPALEMNVHIYIATEWKNEPVETEEMSPKWFSVSVIPYADMWDADRIWLPSILAGKKIEGVFYFDKENKLRDHELKII